MPGDDLSLSSALAAIQQKQGETSVLIYNAFAFSTGKPTALTSEQLLRDLRTNVGGAVTAVRSVAPLMRAAGARTILSTGGSLALEPAAICLGFDG
jgi:NAD(P)-dependent dehydrogenase (short-subunit alcohol dehydrogenase family)